MAGHRCRCAEAFRQSQSRPAQQRSPNPAHRAAWIWHELSSNERQWDGCNMVLRVRWPNWASEMSSPFSTPTNHSLTPGFATPTPTLLHTLQPQQVAWRDDFYELTLSVCEIRTAGQSEFLMVHSMHPSAEAHHAKITLLTSLQNCCQHIIWEQGVMLKTSGCLLGLLSPIYFYNTLVG